MLLLAGCVAWSTKQASVSQDVPYPEHIYRSPTESHYQDGAVAIFCFESPAHAPFTGCAAAHALYQTLLREEVFRRIALEFGDGQEISLARQMEVALLKGYDLVLTGKVLYYFEGTELQPSRVDERIRVLDPRTGELVWYAEAFQVGEPVSDADYVFYRRKGTPAPSAAALMTSNAEKFANFLQSVASPGKGE
jgi:hypothetical protein